MRRLEFETRVIPVTGQRGLSVIEVMVALAASLIVVGSVLAFTVATVRSNSETIRATRLNQDLRVVMGLMTREIRRAGHDALAEQSIASNEPGNRYVALEVNDAGDCIVLAYNRRPGAGGDWNLDPLAPPELREWKGFRRVVEDGRGVIQAFASDGDAAQADPPACNEDGLWRSITSPRQVDVTSVEFLVDNVEREISGVEVTVRRIDVALEARLATDPAMTRQVRESVRIRADDVVFPDL